MSKKETSYTAGVTFAPFKEVSFLVVLRKSKNSADEVAKVVRMLA
jgi:hypothetical protein